MNTKDLKFHIALISTGSFFFIELIFGIITNSLALKADAFHMLSDVIAISIGLITNKISKKSKNTWATYGWARIELIGGLINSVFLISSCLTIFIELIQRIFFISEVKSTMDKEVDKLLVVAVIGLLVNIFNLIVFNIDQICKKDKILAHGHSHASNHNHSNMNIKALVMHMLGDTLGSIGVIITALSIKFIDWDYIYYLDPLCSFLIICIILSGTIPMLIKCLKIVLQISSKKINIKELRNEILSLDSVIDIHEFHIWRLDENKNIASIHVFIDNIVSVEETISSMKLILHKYNIHSTTIQPEFEPKCNEPICKIDCSDNRCCETSLISNENLNEIDITSDTDAIV